jgi:ABC-type bacteriocin/lantibiotic exporter with double-glycine peptidase domain
VKNLRTLLLNRYLIYCLIFVVIEQLIAASSTIWLANLGEAIVTHGNIYLYIALLLLSSCIGFIPWSSAMIMLEKAKFRIKQNYILSFIRNHQGLTTLANRKDIRNDKEAWAIAESDIAIHDLLDYCFNAFTAITYFVLSITAIAFITNSIVVLAHICASILIFICVFLSKKKLQDATENFQTAALNTRRNLLKTWDNVLIGNKYNLDNWTKSYFASVAKLQSKSIWMVAIREISSGLPVLVAILPVGGVIIYLYSQNYNNIAYLAALTTTLPKQMQTIQNMYGFTRILSSWHSLKVRLVKLTESIVIDTEHSAIAAEQFINWDVIDVSSGTKILITSFIDLLNFIQQNPNNRITIKGPNGAGKSTILSILKEQLKSNAIYVPASHDLSFTSTDNLELSQGQRKILELKEIIKNNNASVLLLDEWDANLDDKNEQILSKELDLLAEGLCLIEVRHKR